MNSLEFRPLRPSEIEVLKANGCRSVDAPGSSRKGKNKSPFWNVFVLKSVRDGEFDPDRIVGSFFGGSCNVLGANIGYVAIESDGYVSSSSTSPKKNMVELPCGIYSSTLVDVIVHHQARISRCSLLVQVEIHTGAVVDTVGEILRGSSEGCFGIGTKISVGNSTGGRDICLLPDVPYSQIVQVCCEPTNQEVQKKYAEKVAAAVNKARSMTHSVIGRGARILQCPRLVDVWIGGGTIVQGSTLESVTILSATTDLTDLAKWERSCWRQREEGGERDGELKWMDESDRVKIKEGAVLRRSLVQWGVEVGGGVAVTDSLLMERSHFDRHAKVIESIVGMCSGVTEGECANALMGPLVGFHHQALLIATVWPEGKGNVGHGASVGSNHTGKCPDQELWPGEGVFFGLAVCVKFPWWEGKGKSEMHTIFNLLENSYQEAPYSIIAAGVKTLPEKVCFPFSLINSPSTFYSSVPPALNEIFPGWVLSDSIYTILRNDHKFAHRYSAKRNLIEFESLRPSLIDKLLTARDILSHAAGRGLNSKRDGGEDVIYTEAQIAGLGKNFLTEKSRLSAIQAYTMYIRHYALSGLLREIKKLKPNESVVQSILLRTDDTSSSPRWAHEKRILALEFPGMEVAHLAIEAVRSLQKVAADCEIAKKRDDARGERITPGYKDVHKNVNQDSVVLRARAAASDAIALLKLFGIEMARL